MHFRLLFYPVVFLVALGAMALVYLYRASESDDIPIVAIANYGPHSSLNHAIEGFKEEMRNKGFIEGESVRYEDSDVSFDQSLIPQMIANLRSKHPEVILAVTTPVAQFLKGSVNDIPIVYMAITDPVEAQLLAEQSRPDANMTGSADKQDFSLVVRFALNLFPEMKKIGILYATAEVNDAAVVRMLTDAAKIMDVDVVAVPVDQAAQVPLAMQNFNGKVDVIYVGGSGPIQPSLPAIAAEADKMKIPVINLNCEPVREGMVLASFGVNYRKVGVAAAKMVASLLGGTDVAEVPPAFPMAEDHEGCINTKRAEKLKLHPSSEAFNVLFVGDK